MKFMKPSGEIFKTTDEKEIITINHKINLQVIFHDCVRIKKDWDEYYKKRNKAISEFEEKIKNIKRRQNESI